MHELGITEEILRTALEAAAKEGATRVNDVSISVGELTEVMEFALQFNWDVVTQGTIAESATLTVNMIRPRSRCLSCSHEYDHHKLDFTCPECGNAFVDNLAGRELQIDSIDIDTPDDGADGAADPGEGGPDEPPDE
jgi:hydrogenase nickel incorporation protein HypA/HybF